jgi:hypothetical protein
MFLLLIFYKYDFSFRLKGTIETPQRRRVDQKVAWTYGREAEPEAEGARGEIPSGAYLVFS